MIIEPLLRSYNVDPPAVPKARFGGMAAAVAGAFPMRASQGTIIACNEETTRQLAERYEQRLGAGGGHPVSRILANVTLIGMAGGGGERVELSYLQEVIAEVQVVFDDPAVHENVHSLR